MTRNWRRAAAVALGVLGVLCLSLCAGCGGKGGNQEVAIVDGKSLTEADILRSLDESQRAMVGMWALRKVLVEAEANRWGIEASESEVQLAFDLEQKQLGGPEEYAKALKQSGMTPEGRFAQIPTEILARKILVRDVGEQSEEALRKFLEDNASNFGGQSPRAKLLTIGCETKDKAMKAVERLNAGEDAGAVAKSLGMGAGGQTPPTEAQWVELGQINSPELVEAIKAAESGATVGPFEMPIGYNTSVWVACKVEEMQAGSVPDLESVRPMVELEAKLRDPDAEDEATLFARLFLDHKVEIVGEGDESLAEGGAQLSAHATGPGALPPGMAPADEGAEAPAAEGQSESAAAPAPAGSESAQ